jgi:hypothetical protein
MFSCSDAKFVDLAFSSLFSVINPIEAAPSSVRHVTAVTGWRWRSRSPPTSC